MKNPKLNLKKPSFASKGTRGGGGLKPPKFLADLYADLRDRRLLPLVALLIIGMIAAPILLKNNGEDEPVPSAPPVGSTEATASQASFQVVPAEPGLRDYRKRLGYRQARNPFAQPEQSSAAEEEGAEGSEPPATSASSPISVESLPSSPESEPAPVVVTEETTKTETKTVVQNNVVDYTVNVDAGFITEKQAQLKELNEQPAYTQLPSSKNPVVVYMGLSPDHKRALFLMGNQVVAYYGAGKCTLEQESCQLIELKPGQSETFAYGLEEKPFKLTLKKINEVVEKQKSTDSQTSKHGAAAAGKPGEEAGAGEKSGSGTEAEK